MKLYEKDIINKIEKELYCFFHSHCELCDIETNNDIFTSLATEIYHSFWKIIRNDGMNLERETSKIKNSLLSKPAVIYYCEQSCYIEITLNTFHKIKDKSTGLLSFDYFEINLHFSKHEKKCYVVISFQQYLSFGAFILNLPWNPKTGSISVSNPY